MDYRDADDLYFSIVEKDGLPMFKTVATTSFPNTYRALFGFCARTNALKLAMFDMIDSNNPYAFQALLRCFCEHYLKFTYLFARYVREQTDAPGKDYFSFCGAMEAREYADAIVVAERLVGREVVADIEDFLAERYPDAVGMSVRQLKAASGAFQYRSILRFLSEKTPLLGKDQPTLARIVPLYARLSSFIHGGPASEHEMYSYATPAALEECHEYADLVFVMTASVVMFTALAVGKEYPELLRLAESVRTVVRRFTASEPSAC